MCVCVCGGGGGGEGVGENIFITIFTKHIPLFGGKIFSMFE